MEINLYTQFTVVTVECCGFTFAIPTTIYNGFRDTHKIWYCVGCGSKRHFITETDAERLKKKLSQRDAELNRVNQKLDGVNKSYRKMRKRIASGVCPCCNRTFQNLLNHMKNQHPEFSSNQTLKVLRESYGLTQTQLSKEIGVHSAYISNYENRRPVSVSAAENIQSWIERQGTA